MGLLQMAQWIVGTVAQPEVGAHTVADSGSELAARRPWKLTPAGHPS